MLIEDEDAQDEDESKERDKETESGRDGLKGREHSGGEERIGQERTLYISQIPARAASVINRESQKGRRIAKSGFSSFGLQISSIAVIAKVTTRTSMCITLRDLTSENISACDSPMRITQS